MTLSRRVGRLACGMLLSLAAILCVVRLEAMRAGLRVERLTVGGTPVTLWQPRAEGPHPLVVVAHGYGGSRQLMQTIAISLARSGIAAAAFDFHGHGRDPVAIRGDVASLDGATADLVAQTLAVARGLSRREDLAGPVSLLGHSMGTDVVIRAAAEMGGAASVVAISMYSDAVTPDAPRRLLMVTGAFEGRLRQVALERLRQVDPAAAEGETARAGDVVRRAVAAPRVGHVGVLFSATTLRETRDWIAAASGVAASGALPRTGPWILALLASLTALAWPLATGLGPAAAAVAAPLRRRGLAATLLLPVLPAMAAALAMPEGLIGLRAFGSLAAFFATWGIVQLALLWRAGIRPRRGGGRGALLLLLWGLGLFAPALDRYGAAFVPTGPRLGAMALLLVGTVPFCLADALFLAGRTLPLRLVARALPLAALLGCMILAPHLGVAFTAFPVLALFWVVYGSAARWIGARGGSGAVGAALGLCLAWALAASTPLFAS